MVVYPMEVDIEEFKVNEDGTIPYIKKTAVGLTGTVSQILDYEGSYIFVEPFENTRNDADYPMRGKSIVVDIANGEEAEWEINPGKSDKTKDSYISIESNLKPGMYIQVGGKKSDGVYDVVLSQDVNGSTEEANSMTFRTLLGLTGEGVTFESVAYPGYYLTSQDRDLILASNPDAKKATFKIKTLQ